VGYWHRSNRAGDHIRAQMNGLGKELVPRTIAVLCFWSMVIGLLAGILYQRWMDAQLPQPAQPSAPAVSISAVILRHATAES
jgi:hypothetical protein